LRCREHRGLVVDEVQPVILAAEGLDAALGLLLGVSRRDSRVWPIRDSD
jgi:hypothetical protein